MHGFQFLQIRQQKGINSPGFPIPIFGHSLNFVGVDPCDILEVFQTFFEKKEEKRKVGNNQNS